MEFVGVQVWDEIRSFNDQIADAYAKQAKSRDLYFAVRAERDEARRERDEARAKLAAARDAVKALDTPLSIEDAHDTTGKKTAHDRALAALDAALSDAPALAVVRGGAFKCQIDGLQESWPWGDGFLRIYPTTTVEDPCDDGTIDLAPVTVVVLHANAGGEKP